MFTRLSLKPALLGAASLLSVAVALGSASAEARPGDRAERPHARGDWSSHSERQRTDNGHSTHTSWTASNGKTATRDATVVNDKEIQTRSRDVSYIGPNGEQSSVHDVRQKTDDGHTHNSTFTDSQGRTATREATVVNDKDAGTRTRDVTYTGRGGQQRTVSEVTQKTDNGHTRDTTLTNAKGETATREAVATRDAASGTRTRDVTYMGFDGKTRTVQETAQKTDDGYTRSSTFTNAQGESATRNAVVTNDKDNGTRTHEVTHTGVNGRTATSSTVTTRTDNGYMRDTTVTGPNGASGTREVVVACDKAAGRCTKDVAVNNNK
jgi:hypothetical protein